MCNCANILHGYAYGYMQIKEEKKRNELLLVACARGLLDDVSRFYYLDDAYVPLSGLM